MQLLENLEKIKRTKNGVFIFQLLINHMFFHVLTIFLYLLVTNIMSSDRCTMENIIEVCRRHLVDNILDSGNLIMKRFQNEMRQRFRIVPTIVDKFKEDICVMVNTNFTYIQVVEHWETFLDPLGYELSDETIARYLDLLSKSEDQANYRFGTNEEIIQSAHQESLEKLSHKKIEIIMKKFLIEASMTETKSWVVRQNMNKE